MPRCFSVLDFASFSHHSLCISHKALCFLSIFALVLSALGLLGDPQYAQCFWEGFSILGRVNVSSKQTRLYVCVCVYVCVCLSPQALIKLVCEGVCFRRLLGETCVHVEVKRPPTET